MYELVCHDLFERLYADAPDSTDTAGLFVTVRSGPLSIFSMFSKRRVVVPRGSLTMV